MSLRRGFLNTTYHRKHLDEALTRACATLRGTVIDLGGEWERRGAFQPPRRADLRWVCVNFNPVAEPDVINDIQYVALADACADVIVCTEVLEHVSVPNQVVAEAYRLLRPGGKLIVSVPFMYRVHGDPLDFQRYTAIKLMALLSKTGFCEIDIQSLGFYFTILADTIRSGLARLQPTPLRWILALVILPGLNWLVHYEKRITPSDFIASYVTGYFITARKPHHIYPEPD